MSNDLAVIDTGLSGDRQEIAVTVDRIKSMMPIPDDAPAQAVWGLAQVCVALDLNPLSGEAYLAKFNGKYSPIIGTMGYEKKAQEQSDYHYDIEELDDMEMRKHRGDLFDEEDYGVRISLWRYDKARKCKQIGIPYKPTITYGFWRKKASEEVKWENRRPVPTGKWKPDNIPSSWTKVMVAEKRAIRNAIKRAFTMTKMEQAASSMGAGAQDEFESKTYDVIEEMHHKEQVRTAPIAETHATEEGDDGMMWATTASAAPSEPLADIKTLDDVDELPFDQPESDAEEEEAIAEDPMAQYHMLFLHPEWNLADDETPIFTTLRNADKDGKPTTKKAYGAITGRLNKMLNNDDALRRKVLAVLFGRTISGEVRMSSAAAKSLYEWIDESEKGSAVVRNLISNTIPLAIGKYITESADELFEA